MTSPGGSDEFFREKKAAAVLKHGILGRYLVPFAMKTGSTATGGRVVICDGYSGPGRYDDAGGAPGSPIVLAEAIRSLGGKRNVELVLIEEKRSHHERLLEVVGAELQDINVTVLRGTVQQHLDAVLRQAQGVPFFAFLDPYGLGLPFHDIEKKIFGRPAFQYAPATEVLLNFSSDGTRRVGGYLTSTKDIKNREATLDHMDEVCGGDWWRQVYLDAPSPGAAAEEIAAGFLERICRATRASGWTIDAKNKEHHQPRYNLVHLSRHEDGFMHFAEAASSALGDWRRAVVPAGSFDDDDSIFAVNEKDLAQGWALRIELNLRALLRDHARLSVVTHYGAIFDGVMGDARMTHLRVALKRLHKEGLLSSDGKGSPLWDQPIVRA